MCLMLCVMFCVMLSVMLCMLMCVDVVCGGVTDDGNDVKGIG